MALGLVAAVKVDLLPNNWLSTMQVALVLAQGVADRAALLRNNWPNIARPALALGLAEVVKAALPLTN